MNGASRALARGTLLSVTLRWFIKAMGLISTIILVRFLTPEDYGIIVMAMLVIGLVEIFFLTSADTALLRSLDSSDAIVNSAWTLRLIQAVLVAVIVALLAPFAAQYFAEPRIVPVMVTLGFGIVLAALANIGPVLARKNLEFGLEVKIGVASKVVSFVFTIVAAYILRSYWALVIGTYVGHLASIFFSYKYHPYRPRWDLSRVPELWRFSQWLLVSGIGTFLGKKADELILGRVGDATSLGIYSVASEIGQTITLEIGGPINRSMFPVLSSMQKAKAESLALFFSTLGSINTFTIPVGIGMSVLALPFTLVVFGVNWRGVVPLLEIFALQGAVRFLVSPYHVWFMVAGQTRLLALMSWLELAAFLCIAAFTYQHGVLGLAWAKWWTTVVVVMIWIILGKRQGLTLTALVRVIHRPLLAGSAMAVVLVGMSTSANITNPLVELLLMSALGAVSYLATIAVIWAVSGRPDGIERWVVQRLSTMWHRRDSA